MKKVFIIGLNKTGTCSLESALNRLGYKVKHYDEELVFKMHKSPDKQSCILANTNDHDVFQDIPWCTYWKDVYKTYPNAKYILTERSSADKWLKSITNHTLYAINGEFDVLETNRLTYGYRYPGFHEEEYKRKYLEHNLYIRRFFADKDNLLCWRWSDIDDEWNKLCNFLDKDVPDINFPHSNKSSYKNYERRKTIAEKNPISYFGYEKEKL